MAGPASAGSGLDCDAYAAAAIAQQQQNERLGCGYRGGAWSADYNGHRAWCLKRNVSMANLTTEDGGRWSPDTAGHRGWRMTADPTKPTAEMDRRSSALGKCRGDALLANVDIQNVLQKQQQTMQMLSNASKIKMMHGTSMAVIHKIGG